MFASDMVTVQQVGSFAYWQQPNQFFTYGSVVPCQWHAHSTTSSALLAAATSSSFTPIKDSPVCPAPSFVSPLPVHHHTVTHQYSSPPETALSSRAATVDPEQPIGYGSFGVVW